MADMDRYCIVCPDRFLIPYLFIYFINGKYLARILYQKQENIILDRSQLNGFSVYCNLFIIIIDLKAAALVNLILLLLV